MGLFSDVFPNPQNFYQQLDPNAQQAAAQQYQQQFAGSPDPYVQQQGWNQMDPSQVTPQQLGDMHQYAQQQDPSILSRVMDHPLLDGALVAFGAHEWKEHEEGR